MRLTAWRLLAAASLIAGAAAATRPHYGGTLRAQVSGDGGQFRALTADRLIALDDLARPQPALAISWRHSADFKRWEFQLREGVKLHDGTPLTLARVLEALKSKGAAAEGGSLVIRSEQPAPGLLFVLANLPIDGTGPFRAATVEDKRLVLAANDNYWAGRPFVDSIEIELGRPLRDQALDFEAGKADIVELSFAEARRNGQSGRGTWSSRPATLIALECAPESRNVCGAIALSIDRPAMHAVLLQRQGSVAGAILPQWLSGHAFLFPAVRDLERAKSLAAGAAPVLLSYDAGDTLARTIAERIAVNARDAGLLVRPAVNGTAGARIVRIRLASPDPAQALAAFGGTGAVDSPREIYRAERALLESGALIPLFHVPDIYGLGARVRGWRPAPWGEPRLDSVWLAP